MKFDPKPVDHTKIQIKPVLETNPVKKDDWTVGFKVRIPLERISAFVKKLFQKKS